MRKSTNQCTLYSLAYIIIEITLLKLVLNLKVSMYNIGIVLLKLVSNLKVSYLNYLQPNLTYRLKYKILEGTNFGHARYAEILDTRRHVNFSGTQGTVTACLSGLQNWG